MRKQATYRTAFAPRQRRGISLLEVMLAIAILGGALAVLGQLVRIGARSSATVRDLTQAQLLCENKLAEIAAGVALPEAISQEVAEETGEWLVSVDVQPVDDLGLLGVTVLVEQDPDFAARPTSVQLTRWMVDPAVDQAAAEEQAARDEAAKAAAEAETAAASSGQAAGADGGDQSGGGQGGGQDGGNQNGGGQGGGQGGGGQGGPGQGGGGQTPNNPNIPQVPGLPPGVPPNLPGGLPPNVDGQIPNFPGQGGRPGGGGGGGRGRGGGGRGGQSRGR